MRKIYTKKNKKQWSGFITVEATFVTLIVIFSIGAIMTMFFYQYDLIRLKGEMDEILLQATRLADSYDEKKIKMELKSHLEKELIMAEIEDVTVKKGLSEVFATITTKSEYPWFAGRQLFGFQDICSKTVVKGKIHKPKSFVLRVEVMMDLLSKVKGVSKYIE